jgi:hypothetical protein
MSSTTSTEVTPDSTRVEITIRMDVKGTYEQVAAMQDALDSLASVMVVQAEDGLWTLGSPEAYTEAEGDSEYLADIPMTTASVYVRPT